MYILLLSRRWAKLWFEPFFVLYYCHGVYIMQYRTPAYTTAAAPVLILHRVVMRALLTPSPTHICIYNTYSYNICKFKTPPDTVSCSRSNCDEHYDSILSVVYYIIVLISSVYNYFFYSTIMWSFKIYQYISIKRR